MSEADNTIDEQTRIKRMTACQRRIQRAYDRYMKSMASRHLQKLQEEEQQAEAKKAVVEKRIADVEIKKGLMQEVFYIVSIEYFCRLNDDTYIPAELGMIKFNLEDGVKDQLHMHINPGRIPSGSNYEAYRHTKNTHKLPFPPNALGLTDGEEIAEKVLCFLDAKEGSELLLFANAKDVPAVEKMLEAMLGSRIAKMIMVVCSLSELFLKMQECIMIFDKSMKVFANVRTVQNHLGNDYFSYTWGISCEYHESNELLIECALSQCIRWVYTIFASCCQPLGIKLIPGRHCPGKQELPTFINEENLSRLDDSSCNDDDENDDRISFVSYATGYTSMLPAEVETLVGDDDDIQTVCSQSDVQSSASGMRMDVKHNTSASGSIRDYLESLSLQEVDTNPSPNPGFKSKPQENINYKLTSYGRR